MGLSSVIKVRELSYIDYLFPSFLASKKIIMVAKLFIFACLVTTSLGFAPFGRNCKVETVEIEAQLCRVAPKEVCGTEEEGQVVFQYVAPAEPVCADVVDKICVPALKEEDSCKEHTRKVCVPSDKVVDRPSGKIPEVYASDKHCRLVPKAKCEAHTAKVPKTTCEPIEAKFYHHFW